MTLNFLKVGDRVGVGTKKTAVILYKIQEKKTSINVFSKNYG